MDDALGKGGETIVQTVAESFARLFLGTAMFCFPGAISCAILFDRKEVDWLERIPLSFVLSLGLSAPIGVAALLLHLSLEFFIVGFAILCIVLLLLYVLGSRKGAWSQQSFARSLNGSRLNRPLLSLFAVLAVVTSLLTFNIRTGGDVWTYGGYVREYMNGAPLNESEPFMGTGLAEPPRTWFNFWGLVQAFIGRMARVDAIDLVKGPFAPLVGIISILSYYSWARELFGDRNGALVASILQMLYFASSGIQIGREIGRALFTRTTEDKMVVWLVILPVALFFVSKYFQSGQKRHLVSFTISATALAVVHPLGITLGGISVTSFGIFFAALRSSQKKQKALRVGLVVAILLVLSAIPFVQRQAYASDPRHVTYELFEESDDGSLVPDRRLGKWDHLLWFSESLYTSHPRLVQYPMMIMAIILAPLLLFDVKRDLAAQFLFSNMLASLCLLYVFTPLIGRIITPWLVWRMTWLLPAGLVVAFFANKCIRVIQDGLARVSLSSFTLVQEWVPPLLVVILMVMVLLLKGADEVSRLVERNRLIPDVHLFSEDVQSLLKYLQRDELSHGGTILAGPYLNRLIPSFAHNLDVLEFRGNVEDGGWMLHLASVSQEGEFRQRIEDVQSFFNAQFIDIGMIEILDRYNVRYVVLSSESGLRWQFDALPTLFGLRFRNGAYVLYEVIAETTILPTNSIVSNTYLSQGEWDKAIAEYEKVLKLDPEDTLAHFGLAQAYQAQDKMEQAIAEYEKAITASPDSVWLRLHLGEIYETQGQTEKALAQYQQIIEVESDNPEAYTRLGELYRKHSELYTTKSGLLDEAIALLQEVSSRDPKAIWSHLELGHLYREQGKLDEAIAEYQKAIELRPGSAEAYIQLGDLYRAQGRMGEAIALYQAAARRNSRAAWPHIALGKVYLEEAGRVETD
jgi:tetratricopeptide (TPR) repeat protein